MVRALFVCAADSRLLRLFAQLDNQLLRGTGTSSSGAWYHRMSATLFKLFLGPAGTVTRLHADAGDAHGWLAQVWGAKLFVLYPPTDAPHLRVLRNEVRCTATGTPHLLIASVPADDSRARSPKQRSATWSRWHRQARRAPLDRRRRRTWRSCSRARPSSCRGACTRQRARSAPPPGQHR